MTKPRTICTTGATNIISLVCFFDVKQHSEIDPVRVADKPSDQDRNQGTMIISVSD